MNKNLFKFLLKENKNLIIVETLIFSILSFILFITNLGFADTSYDYNNLYDILMIFLTFGSVLFIFLMFINFVISFSFFHGKDKVDFYHGLPIKRENMFLSTYLSALVTTFIPYILFFILSSILSYFSMKSFSYYFPFETVFFFFIKVIIFSLFFSSVIVLFATVVGKTSATMILILTAVLSPFLLISATYQIFSISINQGITSEKNAILENLFLLLTSTRDVYGTGFQTFSITNAKILILITVFILILANFCYKNFKSENADNFIAVNGLASFFPYFFGFLTAEIVTIFYNVFMETNVYYKSYKYDRNFLLIMFLIAYIISFCLFKTISKGKFNKNFLSFKNICPVFIITFVFFSISFFDVFGLIKKLPDVSKIDEIRFNSMYTFSEIQNKEKLKELNAYMIDASNDIYLNKHRYKRTVFSYINNGQDKTVRYYEMPLDDTCYKMLEEVFRDAEYKTDKLNDLKAVKENLIKSDTDENSYSLNSTLTSSFEGLSNQQALEIIDALYLDIQNDEDFGLYRETTPAVFSLDFTDYSLIQKNIIFEVKPYYENTINYITENKHNMTILPQEFKIVTHKKGEDIRSVYSFMQDGKEYIDLDMDLYTSIGYGVAYDSYMSPIVMEDNNISYFTNDFDSYLSSLKYDLQVSSIEIHTFKDFSELLDFVNSLTIYKTSDNYNYPNYVCKTKDNSNVYRVSTYSNDYLLEIGVARMD